MDAKAIAREHTERIASIMGGAGYSISDELHDALVLEFTNCAEEDQGEGDTFSTDTFLDALHHATDHTTR